MPIERHEIHTKVVGHAVGLEALLFYVEDASDRERGAPPPGPKRLAVRYVYKPGWLPRLFGSSWEKRIAAAKAGLDRWAAEEVRKDQEAHLALQESE